MLLNPLLAAPAIFLRTMFKKLLLATLIVIIGMWGAGYDVWAIKDKVINAADEQAGAMTARDHFEGGGWGPDV